MMYNRNFEVSSSSVSYNTWVIDRILSTMSDWKFKNFRMRVPPTSPPSRNLFGPHQSKISPPSPSNRLKNIFPTQNGGYAIRHVARSYDTTDEILLHKVGPQLTPILMHAKNKVIKSKEYLPGKIVTINHTREGRIVWFSFHGLPSEGYGMN